MKKSNTDSYVITLRLYPNESDLEILNHRFNIVHHITNVLVKHARGCVKQLERDKEYRDIFYNHKKNEKYSKEEKTILSKLRLKYGLDEYQFHSYINKQKHLYEKHIDINTAQEVATKVWRSVGDYLFREGEAIHFKKKKDVNSFEGKSNAAGIRFKDGYVYTNGLKLKTKYRKNDKYIKYALDNHRIKYCRIKRRWHKHQYRYYVDLIMEGIPPLKYRKVGNEKVGIDIGPSTIAVVGDNNIILKELVENVNSIEKQIKILNRKADRQKRANNPNNFNPNGTIKKNTKTFKKKWIVSKKQKLTYDKIKCLHQKRSNQLRESHILLANEILKLGTDIIVEDMQWDALAKKSKKTEISEKTNKFKTKKRFGKSIANHAPSMLINIINTKLHYIGKEINKVDCFKTAATKFNHVTGELMDTKLNDRYVNIDNYKIQRDLHSAFNLKHIVITKTKVKGKIEINYSYDIDAMNNEFEHFIEMHNNCINDLKIQKQLGKKFPSCMNI